MVVEPLAKPANEPAPVRRNCCSHPVPWARIAAAGTLIAGGGLLLGGKRKAGLVAAATGASLALLDQQDTLKSWWRILPGYIDNVQHLLSQVQDTVDDIAVQRDKLAKALNR